jgi:hypothetical protein
VSIKGGVIMTTQAKRATIYFDPELHKALKLKAFETSRSITDLVNEAVRGALSEDAEDIAAFDERMEEPLVSYEQMIKRLKKNGAI